MVTPLDCLPIYDKADKQCCVSVGQEVRVKLLTQLSMYSMNQHTRAKHMRVIAQRDLRGAHVSYGLLPRHLGVIRRCRFDAPYLIEHTCCRWGYDSAGHSRWKEGLKSIWLKHSEPLGTLVLA